MVSDELWGKLTDLSIISGMNQRYAQHMLDRAEWWSWGVDMFVVVSTILCLVLGIVSCFKPDHKVVGVRLDALGLAASVLAAIAGLALVITPFSRQVNRYSQMHHSWTVLRRDIDSVI